MSHRCWTLSPSDFALLWEDCRRCFYLEIVSGFRRPRPAMPKIFTVIDERMKAALEGRRTEAVCPEMPPGVFEYGERRVESTPIDVHLPDRVARCAVRGKLDVVARLDDGTWAVVDFKTSERQAEHVPVYARQLHAYARALEQPAEGHFGVASVSRLGLLVFEPSAFASERGVPSLSGALAWIEVPRDDGAFLGFLAEALSVLEQPAPPGGAPLCDWCVYRDASRRTGL